MVPKRSQERHEAKAASPRRPGRPQETDFPAMVSEVVAKLEAEIEQKLVAQLGIFSMLSVWESNLCTRWPLGA